MRKIYSILLAAFALSAVSCQEEIVDPTVEVPVKEVMTITAGFDTETKTVLTNGVSSLWHENDKVSVFDTKVGDNNRCFSIVKEEGDEFPKATATFATADEFTMPDDQTQDQALIVALYPYQETAYCDFFDPQDGVNDITGITIPVEQVAVADGFDASAAFALATGKYTERDNLRFKNLYSLLKINVLEEGVKKIEVVLETEGFIAGEAQIVLTPGVDENERPVFNGGVLTATGSKSVTLTCEAGFEVGKIYSVAIAPVTYTNVKVYLDDLLAKDTTPATAKTLEPNTFYNIRDLKKLATRGLAFDEATYNVLLGNDFIAPELKGEKEGVVYTSSNEEVATVDAATGAVKVLAEGETVITASAPQTTALLAGEASYTLVVGEKAARNLAFSAETAEATLGAGFTPPTLDGEKAGVVYSSSDTAVATVDAETGEVTLVAVGETTITASAEENETHLEGSASYVLTVSPAPKVERGLAFNPTSVTVTYGETITEPELKGETAGVVYSSSNTAVATVDPETGVLTYGNTAGETTITAAAEANETHLAGSASYKFIVTKVTRTLSFSAETASATYGDENVTVPTLSGDTDGVTFTSSVPGVATVDNSGKVKLVAGGTTVITATLIETATHTGASDFYTLTVAKAARNLAFSESTSTATLGSSFTAPTLTGNKYGVTYTSSNANIATISSDGTITLKAAGKTTITALAAENDTHLNGDASYELTVNHTLYLKPNVNWKSDGARFAAYFFGENNVYTWVNMNDLNSDGIFEVAIPTDKYYSSVIFCRMQANSTNNDFDSTVWNKTKDQTIQSEATKNYFVVKNGSWTEDSDDTWMAKADAEKYIHHVYLKPNSNWTSNNSARFAAYFYVNDNDNCWVSMTQVGSTGVYEAAIPDDKYKNVIFCRMNKNDATNSWENKNDQGPFWNQTNNLTIPTDGKNKYTISEGAWSKGNGSWSKQQ